MKTFSLSALALLADEVFGASTNNNVLPILQSLKGNAVRNEAALHKYETIQRRIAQEAPQAIRKMSSDDGEMFFLDYWGFANHKPDLNLSADAIHIQPALLPISNVTDTQHPVIPRYLSKRDFICPSDTTSCSNLGRSDACCPNGLTCNLVSGQVGCCVGTSCAGQISQCQAGYTSCDSLGGGCCVPGYACASGGCIKTATETIVVTPTQSTTPTPTSTTTSSEPPTTTTSPTTASPPSTSTSSPSPTSTSTTPPSTTSESTTAIIAPARPTSLEPSTSAAVPVTQTATVCPTGFYQCSAYYNPGSCCRVGRDCAQTSCPPSNPSTLLQSDGVTVLVGNGAGGAATVGAGGGDNKGGGACATGWFSCAASLGGNCCPTGFACGTASCWVGNGTVGATGSGTGTPSSTGKMDAKMNRASAGRREDLGVGILRAVGAVSGTLVLGLLL